MRRDSEDGDQPENAASDGGGDERARRPGAAPARQAAAKRTAADAGEELVAAELRKEPEGGRERAGDAPEGREREQPTRGRAHAPSARTRRRTAIGTTPARSTLGTPKSARPRREAGRARGPGSQATMASSTCSSSERDREHGGAAAASTADEEPSRREAVGERSAEPVADGEAGEDDTDQRAPDEEGVAEVRGEDAARGQLDREQYRPGDETD